MAAPWHRLGAHDAPRVRFNETPKTVRLFLSLLVLAAAALACGKEQFEISAISATSPIRPNKFVRVVASTSTGAVCTLQLGEIRITGGILPPRNVAPRSTDGEGNVTFRFGVPKEAVEQEFQVNLSCTKKGETITAGTTVAVTLASVPLLPGETATPEQAPAG